MISIGTNELLDVLSTNCLLILSQVEFSDESDSDVAPQAELKVPADVRRNRTSRRASTANPKTATDPTAEMAATRRPTRAKTSVAKPLLASSEDDEALLRRPASSRRGRSRKQMSKTEEQDEPDTMRTIAEEADGVLDISIEQLRMSDAEENQSAAAKDISMFVVPERKKLGETNVCHL